MLLSLLKLFAFRILELVYRISLEEEHNNRFAVIRAERWAALIKKDNELGKYLFLFSEMSFVAKVFSFLDKALLSRVTCHLCLLACRPPARQGPRCADAGGPSLRQFRPACPLELSSRHACRPEVRPGT